MLAVVHKPLIQLIQTQTFDNLVLLAPASQVLGLLGGYRVSESILFSSALVDNHPASIYTAAKYK